ncbi:MAG TPA: class I mannose-6-phosphate isomerase [Bacteroidales bacterium]|nr:class I mannose-6-phosphate isomerase [Bacteroidales bacterium]
MDFRNTTQYLLPSARPLKPGGRYDIYPDFEIGNNMIHRGVKTLAGAISAEKLVIIDGFSGVFFDLVRESIDSMLKSDHGISAVWIDSTRWLRSAEEIEDLISPFAGGDDPLFGSRCSLQLTDFFVMPVNIPCPPGEDMTIIYGTGAALFSRDGFLVWLDLPKNEVQFRSRAGKITNLGAPVPYAPKEMYKRFYFIDWVVLNRHRESVVNRIGIFADAQRPDDITWMRGDDFTKSLAGIAESPFRVRPWFEPGTWGGSWIKDKIAGVNSEVPNYAWSFELIAPENGIILSSSGILLEFSFDFLMILNSKEILGHCSEQFGTEFPLRFDFLDTFGGGNLSIQCHPLPGYMKDNFGENFTQEESYYILDAGDNAGVYLGFREDIDRERFRDALTKSLSENVAIDIEDFVLRHPSHKHDLFLIPSGTVHGSGKNNLVLEISSTPYIFTFKLYDWLRPDLDGKPRPLNIERGMENLCFGRKGELVPEELICRPYLEKEETGWKLYHLPTHETQLYDVQRYHIATSAHLDTGNKCLVMNLVQGNGIRIECANGRMMRINYAETFIIPAAAGRFTIINESAEEAMIVAVFVRDRYTKT